MPGPWFKIVPSGLEKPFYQPRLYVHIDFAEGRAGRGTGHETDGPGTRAEELRPGIDQYVADG